MYLVAVIANEVVNFPEITEMFAKYQSEKSIEVVAKKMENRESLLNFYEKEDHHIDIIILGISNKADLEDAIEIKKIDKCIAIILVSNVSEYAIDAFRLGVAGYLVNPMEYQFKIQMEKAVLEVEHFRRNFSPLQDKIMIEYNGKKTFLALNTICYIKKSRNACVFYTMEGEYICYSTLEKIYSQLSYAFMYCHQSYIINCELVKEIRKNKIIFSDEMIVPISRSYVFIVKNKLNGMFRKKVKAIEVDETETEFFILK